MGASSTGSKCELETDRASPAEKELRLWKVKWPKGRVYAARSGVVPWLKPGDGSQHWRGEQRKRAVQRTSQRSWRKARVM